MFQDAVVLLPLGSHKFVNNDRILTKPVPMERSRSGLSIDTGFVENSSLCTKLRTNKIWGPIEFGPVC